MRDLSQIMQVEIHNSDLHRSASNTLKIFNTVNRRHATIAQ